MAMNTPGPKCVHIVSVINRHTVEAKIFDLKALVLTPRTGCGEKLAPRTVAAAV